MSNYLNPNLFEKYDIPMPRYTSYPAVPNWANNVTTATWISDLTQALDKKDTSLSLYIHLPFCESLCTFCACNNVITKDHTKESRYVDAVLKEWSFYLKSLPELKNKYVRQVHLGGGSPTFFHSENLRRLLENIFKDLKIDPQQFEGSVEVDPRRCEEEQLVVLREFGFNRVSLGVQDFDERVQKYVNRIQPFEMVENCTNMARNLGYKSINFDLIYGLPGQTEESMKITAEKVMLLKPDRIALYSLAIVPWLRPAHGKFERLEMKKGFNKRKLFETAKAEFMKKQYIELGIDHFAAPDDAIAKSFKNGTLHRNFMGYAEYSTDVLLGLGTSAISETESSFHQNRKNLEQYYQYVEMFNSIPTQHGHILTAEDQAVKKHILNLMTNFRTPIDAHISKSNFDEMRLEGLLNIDDKELQITELGVPFARHICNKIDKYVKSEIENQPKRFSSGV